MPKTNVNYWYEKFKNNIKRDKDNYKKLIKMGYKVIVIWECQVKNIAILKKLYNKMAIIRKVLNGVEFLILLWYTYIL